MTEIELFYVKLREHRDYLRSQIKEIQKPNNDEIDLLRERISEIRAEEKEIKEKILAIRSRSKADQGRVLEIVRKLRAISQLLDD